MNNFQISRKDLKQCNYNGSSCEAVEKNETSHKESGTVTPEVMLAIILFDLIKAGEAE